MTHSSPVAGVYKTNSWPVRTILAFGLMMIMAGTLFPFPDWNALGAHSALLQWYGFDGLDELENVLLFVPLGFGLAGVARYQRGALGKVIFLAVMAAGFNLSILVEIIQVFMPGRASTLNDVISNTGGTILGYGIFSRWGTKTLSFRASGYIILSYIALVLMTSGLFQRGSLLTNWDESFPLVLGNEYRAERHWQGTLFDLFLADRALSTQEIALVFSTNEPGSVLGDSLLVRYRFQGQASDRGPAGYLPGLVWNHETQASSSPQGVTFTPDRYLLTPDPPAWLTRRIGKTSQFTLGVTLANADCEQRGPARIVSYSYDASTRNFTLGQARQDLVFRLRTPMTGNDGTNPALVVPGVFSNTRPKNLIVSYDGSVLRVYVDGRLHTPLLELTPGTVLYQQLVLSETVPTQTSKILFYMTVFCSLGILLSIIPVTPPRRSALPILVVICGWLLTPLFLEGLAVGLTGKFVQWNTIWTNYVWTGGAWFVAKVFR